MTQPGHWARDWPPVCALTALTLPAVLTLLAAGVRSQATAGTDDDRCASAPNVATHAGKLVADGLPLPVPLDRPSYSAVDCLAECCRLPECRFATMSDFVTGQGRCDLFACTDDRPCAVQAAVDGITAPPDTVTIELTQRRQAVVRMSTSPEVSNTPTTTVVSAGWLSEAARACATPLAVGGALLVLCACANAAMLGVILRRRKAGQGNWDRVQARQKSINGAQLGQGTLHAYNNVGLQA